MKTHTLGFPRIGAQQELTFALERHWNRAASPDVLPQIASDLRSRHWLLQRHAGLDFATGDFSLCDSMLDTAVMFGATPARFGFEERSARPGSDRYFELARGNVLQCAMETNQWFDTDYRHLVPELAPDQRFELDAEPLLDTIREVEGRGFTPKPVLIGPLTFLWMSKVPGLAPCEQAAAKLALLPSLLPLYRDLLTKIEARAVGWVQIDEPILGLDLPSEWLAAFESAYDAMARPYLKILLATYFGSVARHLPLLARLRVDGLHVDLVRAPQQSTAVLAHWPRGKVLSAGVIDGRNVRRADLRGVLEQLAPLYSGFAERLWLAPSCSLLHCPADLSSAHQRPSPVRDGLAFVTAKLDELSILKRALWDGETAVASALAASDLVQRSRRDHAASSDASLELEDALLAEAAR